MGFLLTVILALIVIGILLWAIEALPFIDANIKQIIRVLVIVVVALWIIGILFGYFPVTPLPAIRR